MKIVVIVKKITTVITTFFTLVQAKNSCILLENLFVSNFGNAILYF